MVASRLEIRVECVEEEGRLLIRWREKPQWWWAALLLISVVFPVAAIRFALQMSREVRSFAVMLCVLIAMTLLEECRQRLWRRVRETVVTASEIAVPHIESPVMWKHVDGFAWVESAFRTP